MTSAAEHVWKPAVVILLGLFTGILALFVAAADTGRQFTPLMTAAGLAALAAHGSLLFSVMFAAALGRFALASWPAVTTSALLGVWTIARELAWRVQREMDDVRS